MVPWPVVTCLPQKKQLRNDAVVLLKNLNHL
jgi:hypothetical protein